MSTVSNVCNFIGNLGKDVDISYTPKGTAVAKFSMGVNRPVKKGDKWENETDWVSVVAYGGLAERVAKILQKGTSVFVTTTYRSFTYKSKNDETKYGHEFLLNDFKPLSKYKEGGSGGSREGDSSSVDDSDDYYDEEEDDF